MRSLQNPGVSKGRMGLAGNFSSSGLNEHWAAQLWHIWPFQARGQRSCAELLKMLREGIPLFQLTSSERRAHQ